MDQQNFATHRRWVPMYHFVLSLLLILLFIGSIVNLVKTIGSSSGYYSASLILGINISLLIIFFYMREFALKAQDRAIKAEENFRHYLISGKPMDSRMTVRQIIGLRFADDSEFVELAKKAVDENLSETAIKKSIKKWRPDNYRV